MLLYNFILMKKILLIQFLTLLCFTSAHSQKLRVESFAVKANDLTARTQPRQDNNGVDCALVKVQLASSGATFGGNVVGDVKYNTSEYWTYMSKGSKRLSVKLEGYLPLEVNFDDYDVNQLESKTVYVMVVSGVTTSQSLEAPRIKTGWIIIDAQPSGASVFINDEFVGNTPLTNYKQAYGTYSYRVEHPNYHSSSGTLELNSGKLEKKIELTPAFGSIAITSNVTGAKVLLDGKATNKVAPCTLTEVPSGQHTITIQRDKYSPCQQNVTVEDGHTVQLTFSLDARFAQVTISTLPGAQIFCNGEQRATTKLIEDMMEGFYDVEVRLAHHKPATKQIQVQAGQSQDITINPIPIYGTLDIISTPHDADVTIDGKEYGKTPITIEKILEGDHEVSITKTGYEVIKKKVVIRDSESCVISEKLKESALVTDVLYDRVEQAPKFKEGDIRVWLANHMEYPQVAYANRIQGRVVVGFVVEKDGSITNVHVLSGVDPSLDKEAVRVVKSMPKWNPGMQDGSPARVKYHIPINFGLK